MNLNENNNLIQNEYIDKTNEKQSILNDLRDIVIKRDAILEGNSFYYNATLDLYPELYTKQLNLFWCGKQAETRICEIGFNAGHSTMLMLLGRDSKNLDFTIFDIGSHKYVKPCFEYIKSKFQHINFEYIEGNSIYTIPEWIHNNKHLIGTYDVIHIDGGHSEECIFNDMKNCDLLIKKNGIIIIDDTNMYEINIYVDLYISSGNYIELNVYKTYGYEHRIIQKIR